MASAVPVSPPAIVLKRRGVRPRWLSLDLIVYLAVALLVVWLNYYADAMRDILPNYLDFKRIILAGFDPSVALRGEPTFPMWGYGWVLLVTENHLAIILAQVALAAFTAQVCLRYVASQGHLSRPSSVGLRWCVALALPWHAFHTVLWPYSPAICCFLLALVTLHRALSKEQGGVPWIIASGLLFGLTLNFRSDYFLMPLGLAVAAVVVHGAPRRRQACLTAVWCGVIYATLVPWMAYTRHVTGTALVSSTNSGHTAFVGLGILPHNKWGITVYDEDPLMHRLVDEHFYPGKTTLDLDSDRFLRERFWQRVSAEPREYARKCAYAATSILTCGVYSGEFYLTSPSDGSQATKGCVAQMRELAAHPTDYVGRNGVQMTFRWVLQAASMTLGIASVALSYALLPVVLLWSLARRRLFWLLVGLAIVYQTTLQALLFTMPAYTSNLLFLHFINAACGLELVGAWLLGRSCVNKAVAVTTKVSLQKSLAA